MHLDFKHIDVKDLESAAVFEHVYEESLRLDADDKQALLCESDNGLFLFVDGVLAGETYGVTPALMDEEIEDCDPEDNSSIYCYSTTILPAFQGKGLGKLLKAYWLGLIDGRLHPRVIGHATSPAMMAINNLFNAKWGPVHTNWYGTERTARFYEIEIA